MPKKQAPQQRDPDLRAYLGDGVYVDVQPSGSDYGLVLTTEDGKVVTNRIVLEPHMWEALKGYVEALQRGV